ncbi:MAG: hypothetical protein H6Q33_1749 [Deltaproteobacteria bacterium]|nr:hypothetical protein [Deltaproteobacteria bacterium]
MSVAVHSVGVVMVSQARQQRSVSELVFVLLNTLLVGYQIWGIESGLPLVGLADRLRVSDARLLGVMAYLTEEGLVAVDAGSGTVRLTPQGADTLGSHARRVADCAT